MPATLHEQQPGSPKEFMNWLEPGDMPHYGFVSHPTDPLTKLFVVYCMPDDVCTAVYERSMPVKLTPQAFQIFGEKLFNGFDFKNDHVKNLLFDEPHEIEVSDQVKGLGVLVTHRAFKARQFE